MRDEVCLCDKECIYVSVFFCDGKRCVNASVSLK